MNEQPSSQSPPTKTCPFCKTTDVAADASRCPHCAGDIAKQELLNSKVCFVATAALGNVDHPDVQVLREVRNQVLLENPVGRAAVRLYWLLGPTAAKFIAASPVRRRAARMLIVAPAANLARKFLSAKRT